MSNPFLPLMFRFLWMYIAGIVIISLVAAGIGIGSGATSLLPIMIAAMDGGTRFVKRTGRRPSGGEMWQLALVQTMVTVILAIPLIALIQYSGLSAELDDLGSIIAIILVVAAFVNLLVARVFIGIGVKVGVKQFGDSMADPRVFQ